MFIINKYKSFRASSETQKNLSVLKQPALSLINDHLIAYPTPSNLNYFWGFGSLAGISLVVQIATGVFLACHYTPEVSLAFSSVEHIMRDVQGGFLLRYAHANGASMFFVVTMIHVLRGLYYGSYQAPREAVWCVGVIILFLMIATAFMGGRICAFWLIEILCYNEMDVLCVEQGHLLASTALMVVPKPICFRAYARNRPTTARLTNLNTPHNTGERMPPTTRTLLLLRPYTGWHPTSSGISSGSGKVRQRDGLRQYRRHKWQGPKVGARTVSATKSKGTDDMQGKTCRSGEGVVAIAIVNRHTAICCEGPQPGRFLGFAIKASQKIRNLDWSVFSIWELANALAQIEHYAELARRNPGHLGRLNVHKILGNQSFLIYAYSLTKDRVAVGMDNVVPKGLTSNGITRLAREIREGTYTPKPSKRVMIPKAVKGQFRPLGIASSRDKVVQQALKLCLEPLFEPTFTIRSHGFRPGLSCHSALRQVDREWQNPTWLLEFDLAKAYDTINHRVLMNRINSRFRDRGTNRVIWKMLKTGYINPLSLVDSDLGMEEGTPQGSIISPLMANIYFHALDKWMEDVVVPYFSTQDENYKVISERYLNAVSRWKGNPWEEVLEKVKVLTPSINTDKRREMIKRIRALQARADNTPYSEKSDTKLHYVRYADDFLLGYRGTKSQARQIKQLTLYFIENELKMQVNVEKSGIHHKKEGVMFLGYKIWLEKDITVRNSADEPQRRTRTRLKFTIPIERLFHKYAEKGFFQKPSRGKTKRLVGRYQTKYVFMHPYHIIQRYNSIVRGLVNYYSGSERLSDLHKFLHELRRSAALTIAHYHKESSAKKMFNKYGKTLKVSIGENSQQIVEYLTPNLTMRRPQDRWNTGQINNISRNKILSTSVPKTMTMIKSAKDLTCAIPDCGSKAAEWHHIRHQRKVGGLGVKRTLALQSARQIPVCKKHHNLIHKGAYNGPSLKKLPAYE